MTIYPAHAGKCVGNDTHPKMRLAAAVKRSMVAGVEVMMAGVQVALIDHIQPLRRERL